MGKSGHLYRYELDGASTLEIYGADEFPYFSEAGWLPIINLFSGHTLKYSSDFVDTFDGNNAKVEGLLFPVTKETVAKVTNIAAEGEMWFKRKPVQGVNLNFFLKDNFHDPCWSVGVHSCILKPKWEKPIRQTQLYLTSDGRFSKVFLYHMRFLVQMVGFNKMNLPYFLHQSLIKWLLVQEKGRFYIPMMSTTMASFRSCTLML